MKSPFVFSKIVTGKKFVGREQEIKKLANNFRDGINTFVISPRRTGKSSLVRQSVEVYNENKQAKDKTIFVFVNLWNIRTEGEFYELLANQILKATSNKFSEVIDAAKTFLGNLKPTIKLEYETVKFEVGLTPQKEEIQSILDLSQKIAEKKKKQIVICLDEFQDIEHFKDSISFQKNLRSHWQNQKDVSYILYGSKRHMMSNLFNNSSMPFYRFGDVVYLKKIEESKLNEFIVKSFQETNKLIQEQDAALISKALNQHPYYIQQLCNIIWQNTSKEVTQEIINDSMNDFIEYNSGQFELIVRNLSATQLNFLKALCHNEYAFHSQPVLEKYHLGSSANVTSIKKALLEKEIVDEEDGHFSFSDPVLEIYFIKKYGEDSQ